MKKTFYEKPTTKVVVLQQRCHILAGSETPEPTPERETQRTQYEEVDW